MNVLVSQRVDVSATGERRDALDQRWFELLAALDAVAFPVPNHPGHALAMASAMAVDGIVLSGGNDVGSAPERDRTESTLIDWAMARSIPVLGVCRGLQFLTVHLGGALTSIEGHVSVRHAVAGPWGRQTVNSFHHFAVAALPPSLEAVAHADDGTVEAFRHPSLPLAGIMWHPERDDPPSAASLSYLSTFFSHHRFELPCAF